MQKLKNRIRRIIQKFIIKYLKKNSSNENMQSYFNTLLGQVLHCMNYGKIEDFTMSGELNAIKYIKNKLNNDVSLTIFDVGANVGEYAKALAKLFTKNVVIHSFEPSKRTYSQLCNNVSGIDTIVPHNIGMSSEVCEMILHYDTQASGLASLYDRNLEHYNIALNTHEEVKLETIDWFCNKNKIDKIHFLKLDIEGHEMEALKGAKGLIDKQLINFIQFEFGGCNIDSRTYFKDFYYFLKNNYKIYRILEKGLEEIKSYDERKEIFLTINYLAELKSNND